MTIASGNAASTTPDNDGDRVRMARLQGGRYSVTTEDADGDFRTAYVSREDMLALARWIIEDEA
jgi:hypothetical protein